MRSDTLLLFCVLTVVLCQKNVILLIGDGFGPCAHTLARTFLGRKTSFDKYHLGTIQTYADGALITDSAAGATAYSTGRKTKNKYVAMDPAGKPLKTILEAARDRGMRTGLVTTTSLQHATPACFSAHTTNRDEYALIADQQSRANVSVMFGGGRRWVLPREKGGDRTDGRDITQELERKGVQILRTPHEFMNTRLRIPVHAFVAHDQMPMELDRPKSDPSLLDFTRQALNLLNGSREGFFLMIEGGRIDHAFHQNDGGAALREIDQFDHVLEYVVNFARSTPNTVVLASADHETGGVTIGDATGGYNWYPEVFKNQAKSTEFVEKLLKEGKDIRQTVKEHLKIDLTNEQFEKIRVAVENNSQISAKAAQVVGNYAKIAYTTTGHTGIDVYSQGFGPGVDALRANHENTDIAKFIIGYLNLNMNW